MKNPEAYIGKYIQVFDKNNTLIVSGLCTSLKPNYGDIIYISFDDKWFYGNKTLVFKEVDYADSVILPEPPNYLTWDYWRNHPKRQTEVDVYRDFSYDEIDEPIRNYVDKLNQITDEIQTCDSCCGHGISNWFISFRFKSISSLSRFLKVLATFQDKLVLISNSTHLQFNSQVMLQLKPYESLDQEFVLLEKFVKRLTREFEFNSK